MNSAIAPLTPGPLRILHLVPTLMGGGSERQVSYLANAQASMGLDVHVGYVHDGPNLELLRGTSVKLHRLSTRSNHDPLLMLKLVRLMSSIAPDLVQTWLLQMDVLGGIAASVTRVPWVLSERAAPYAHRSGWKNRLRRALGKRASAIIANSSIGSTYWDGVPAAVLRRTIHNIVPFETIAAAAPIDDPVLAHAGQLVVAAGRLEAEKNWFVLLEALDRALRARPDAHAVIFGEGTLRIAMLEAIANCRCSGQIHLPGYAADLWRWLKRAAVFVSVSHSEGSPNAVLEAIACGCPVVLSDIPGHRELLSSTSADFVPADSAPAVANALDLVLDDTARARVRAAGAMDSIRQWSAGSIAAQYHDAYQQVLRRSRGEVDLAREST